MRACQGLRYQAHPQAGIVLEAEREERDRLRWAGAEEEEADDRDPAAVYYRNNNLNWRTSSW